jgi:hypothetical protein
MADPSEVTLQDMVSQLSDIDKAISEEDQSPVSDKPPEDEPPPETPDSSGTPEKPTEGDQTHNPETEDNPEKPGDKQPPQPPASVKPDQQQHAFAQLRIQNKQYSDLLKAVGEMLGVDTKDPEALVGALKDKVLTSKAEAQKVPKELLERLDRLETKDEAATQRELYESAVRGFEAVKQRFNLTQDQLNAFAKELVDSGKHPYKQQVNMIREYQLLHFEDIQKAAIAEALEAERAKQQARTDKINQHSTSPGYQNGATPDKPSKINSVRDLEKYLADQLS